MTLDEAIKHAEETAETRTDLCAECRAEHKQLADWLKELKEYHTADVVPRSEVEHWKEEANHYQTLWCETCVDIEKAKQDVAREIFKEIETSLVIGSAIGSEVYYAIRAEDYLHYKKKYIGE